MHFFDLSRYIVQPVVSEWLDSKALLQFFLTVFGDRSKRRFVDLSGIVLALSKLRDEAAIKCQKLLPAFLATLPEETRDAFFADTTVLNLVIKSYEEYVESSFVSAENRVSTLSVILLLKRKCFDLDGVNLNSIIDDMLQSDMLFQYMLSGFVCSFSHEQMAIFIEKLIKALNDQSNSKRVAKAQRLFLCTVQFLKQNEGKLYEVLGVVFNLMLDNVSRTNFLISLFEEAFLYLPAKAKERVFAQQKESFLLRINADFSNDALAAAMYFKPDALDDKWAILFNRLTDLFLLKKYQEVLKMIETLSTHPSFEEEFLKSKFFACVTHAIYDLDLKSDPEDDRDKNDFAGVEIIASLIPCIAKVTNEKEKLFSQLLLLNSYNPSRLSIILKMFIELVLVLDNSERFYLFLELNKILLWSGEDSILCRDIAHAALKKAFSDSGQPLSWAMFQYRYENIGKEGGVEPSDKSRLIAEAGAVAIAFVLYMSNNNLEKIIEHLKELFEEESYKVMSASVVVILKDLRFKEDFLNSDFLLFIMSRVDEIDLSWDDGEDKLGVQYDSAWLRDSVVMERIIESRACVEAILSSSVYESADDEDYFNDNYILFGWYIVRRLPYFFSRKENIDFVSVFIQDRKNLLKMISVFGEFDWRPLFYELSKTLSHNDVDDLIHYASSALNALSGLEALQQLHAPEAQSDYHKLICLYLLPAHIERHFDLWEKLWSICNNVSVNMPCRTRVFEILAFCIKSCVVDNLEQLTFVTHYVSHAATDAFFDSLIEILLSNCDWALNSVLSLLQSLTHLPSVYFNKRMQENNRLIDAFFRIVISPNVQPENYKIVMDLFTSWIVQGFDFRAYLMDHVELTDTGLGKFLCMVQEAWELSQAPKATVSPSV